MNQNASTLILVSIFVFSAIHPTAAATAPTLVVNGMVDATILRGSSASYNISVMNAASTTTTVEATVSGDVAAWVTVSQSSTEIAPGKFATVTITITVPKTVGPGSYYGKLTLTTGGISGSAILKVRVPTPTLLATPSLLEFHMAQASVAGTSILLTNVGLVDIDGIKVSILGDASRIVRVATNATQLKVGSSAEALLEASADVSPGAYSGVLTVTSSNARQSNVSISIVVTSQGSPTIEARIGEGNYGRFDLDAGTSINVPITVRERSNQGVAAGLVIQAGPALSAMVSGQLQSSQLSAGATMKGSFNVKAPTNTLCGFHSGKVSIAAGGTTYAEAPVVLNVRCQAAGGAIRIDGTANDWANLRVNTIVFDEDGDATQNGSAVDIIVGRLTESSGSFLATVNVKGEADPSRTYGINFDVNGDSKTDYSLVLTKGQAVLTDAQGKIVSVLANALWAYSSGIVELAVDVHEIQSSIGKSFSVQIFAMGSSSYDETVWVVYRGP